MIGVPDQMKTDQGIAILAQFGDTNFCGEEDRASHGNAYKQFRMLYLAEQIINISNVREVSNSC